MTPRPPMKMQHFRSSQELWDKCLAVAEQCDEVWSEELRKFMETYSHKLDNK